MSTEFDPYNFSAFGGDLNNIELDSDIDNPLKSTRLRRGPKQPSQLLGKRRRSRVSSSVRIGTGNKGPTTNQSQLYQTLYEQNNNITTDYSYLNRSYPLYDHHPASIADIEGNNKITEQPLPTGNDSSFGVRSTNRSALKQLAATTTSISSQNPYYQTQQRSLDRTYEYHQTRPSLKQQLQQPFSTMPHMSSGGGSGGGGHHHNQSSNSISGSGQSTNSTNSGSNKPPMKAKRTRQRVDAGEPRNSYASIANFSSRGGYHGYNHNKYGSNSSSGNNGSNNSSNHNSNQNQNNPNHYHHHHHHNHLMNNNNNSGGGGNLSSHHNSQQNPNNSSHYNYHHAQVNHHHQQQHSHHHHQHHHPQATMATAAFNNNTNNVNLVPSTHHQPQHQLLQNSLNQDLQQSFTNNGNHNTNINKGAASSLLRDSTGSFPFGHHPSLPTATAGAASVPRSNDPIQSMMDSNLLQMCQNQMVAFMSGAYASNPAAAAAAATINAAAVTNSKQSPSSPSSSSFKFPLEPNAEQFAAMQNSFYNPTNNVFLNHLQQNTDPGLAITNLINNFQNETIVNNQFLNMAANSFDAQLLRDILESGGTSNSGTLGAGTGTGAGVVGGGNVNNHRPDKAQLALQQAIANRLSYLTNNNENINEPKQSSSRSNATNKASSSSSSSTFATNKQRFDDLLDQWSVFDFDQQSLNSQSLQMVDKMDSCQLSIPGGGVGGREDHHGHNDDDGHRPIRPDEQDEDNNNNNNNTGNNDGLVEEAERKNTNQRYYNNSYRGQNSVAFQCADNNSNNNNNSHKTITDENNMNGKNSKEINNEEGYVEQQQQQPTNEEPDAATETTKKRPEEQNKEQHQHQQQQITENGSGNVDIDKEVVNVPMEMRDGNLSKEERVDGGRGRPPTHSSVHSRSKSANMVSLLGSTSSSFSSTSSSSSPTSSSTSSSTPTSTSSRTSSTSSSSASATSTPSPKSGTISLDQQPTSTKQNGSSTTKAKLCSDSSTNRDLSPNNNRQSYQKTSSSSTAITTIEQERAELISVGVVGCEQPSGITEIVREQENQDDEDESTTNMLLETSVQQATNNHSIENNIHPSPKSDCEDIEMMDAIKKHQFKQQQKQQLQQPKSISPSQRQQQQQQGVNGCKKRKLYQPQQTSKMLINSNGGSVIDTEEDDDEEEEDDDDVVDDGDEDLVEEEIEIPREVEDTASVEAELDEGYDESGEEQRQQSRQKIITTTTTTTTTNNNNTNVDGVVVNNKELDLSTTTNNNITNSSNNNNNNSRLPRNNHHQTSSSEPTAQRSPINQAKRARLSDYERDIGRIQQQLLQKYSQFYQQQQQQIHLHHHHHQPQQQLQPQPLQQQNQSKSMINGGLYNNSNNINNRLASPINLAPIMANDCDTNLDIDLELKDNHPGSHHHQHQLKFRNQNHRENPDKFYKVHDVDLFIETVTDQIIQSIGKVIGNSIRQELELQNVNNNKSLQTSQQQPPEVPMPIHKSTDLLAQMLDGKYNRSMLKTSLTNNTAVMAAVSPRSPKNTNNNSSNNNSNHSKNLVGHETSSFLLPNETSESPASLKSTIHPQAALTPNSFLAANQPKTSSLFQNNPLAAVYNNARDNATTMLLNGLRESSNSSISSSLVYGRDEPSPGLPEQTEAISLVVGTKKRRNKVTDTRLTPRTITRIPRGGGGGDDGGRETCSVSPPVISNGGGPVHFPSTNPHGGVPVSLASLQQHANEYYDPINNSTSATTFPFAEQNPLGSFFGNPDLNVEMKNGLANINGMVNGSGSGNGGSSDPVVSAVAQAAAAHHLKLLATSRASPDSLNGYGSAMLTSYGHGSGTGSENGGDGSETNDTPSIYDPSMPMTSTLSPMHLRKAKLMFFYVRYPSSSILKMFFPDIKFNKNNTAQLVKWFSNFREFYYIQMEKYARQALNDGVKGADDLNVTDDCELLRVLNLHYNRSNHIPIPENFRTVSETTLREFFKSLQQNKDTEQSWKKAIYKVIARLDDSVPEYFKNPNFMEQLE